MPLFRDLLPRELETVQSLLSPQTVSVDTELVSPQQQTQALYFLQTGALKVAAVFKKRELIVEIRGPGTLTGTLPLFDGDGLLRVTAQTPCEVAVLSRFDFWNTVWPMPAVPFNVAHLLAAHLRERNEQILGLGTLDVTSRIARQLAKLARLHGEENGGSIELNFPLTQSELAQMLGTSRVHLNQILGRWSASKIVQFQRGKIVIHNPQALYALAERGD